MAAINQHWIKPIELTGTHVRLVPLQANHKTGLLNAAADGKLWQLWYTSVPSPDTIEEWFTFATDSMDNGQAMAFVVQRVNDGKIIGSTRYCNVAATHRRLEIGYTWYAKQAQRTAVNTECKLLLLQHAFETLDAIAVEFRTHWHNLASRNAISRLGAKQDGVLRQHQIMPDGTFRDTVVFSILNHEWPAVKNSLLYKLSE